MGALVLIAKAVEESNYTTAHIRLLLRRGLIKGEKQGAIWLVDLDSLKSYEQQMNELGDARHDPRSESKIR
jgi:hypothetical protein